MTGSHNPRRLSHCYRWDNIALIVISSPMGSDIHVAQFIAVAQLIAVCSSQILAETWATRHRFRAYYLENGAF